MKDLRKVSLPRLLIGLLLAGGCLWFLGQQVDRDALTLALAAAEKLPIIVATVIILLTSIIKSWRWQLLFSAETRPTSYATYRALMLGQMINLISPIPRLGDVVRIIDLHKSQNTNRAEAMGTLVSEKSFDMLFSVLTIVLLLPLIAVPQFISSPLLSLGIVVGLLLLSLALLVLRGQWVLGIFGRITAYLPQKIGQRLNKIAAATLHGFSALRDPRLIITHLLLNALLVLLAIATPWLLFRAFHLDLNLASAFLLNIAVLLGLTLPSAPARIGTFEGIVYAMLAYFSVTDEALQLSYAIVFHVVVVVPPLLIGTLFALTSRKSKTS